jgi:hypothetical protein
MLLRDYNYELQSYKLVKADVSRKTVFQVLFIIFGLISIVFLLDVTGIIDLGFNFILYFISFIFFVAFPLGLQKEYLKEFLLITPDYMIQRADAQDFRIVKFDEISKFEHTDMSIILYQQDMVMELFTKKYVNDIPMIIDILEAKGKTFDKKKDFMIRPITVIIEDGVISIKDVKQKKTKTDKLMGDFTKKYDFISPGFLQQIIPKNGIVKNIEYNKKDMFIYLSHFTVHEGHPENSAFGAVEVEDCIMIFEDFKLNTMFKRPTNDRSSKYVAVENDIEQFIKDVKSNVISEWKFNRSAVDFVFAVGVGSLKVNFNFTDVIIGWNIEK